MFPSAAGLSTERVIRGEAVLTSSIPKTAGPPPTSLLTNVERESEMRSNPLAIQRRTSLVAFGVSLNASAAEIRMDKVDGRVIRSEPTGLRPSTLRARIA
jgi:hypothetical protein